jgi:hypothetical protein
VPVIAGYIPHDRLKAKFVRDPEHRWAASAEGRAKQIGMLANRILQCRAAFGELPPDFSLAFKNQQGMRESMIADNVAGLDNLAHDIRTLSHVASDQKKSCLHAMLGESFEQAQRVRIVGTIVISQRQLPRARSQSYESSSIPLPGRRHGLITRSSSGRSRDGTGQSKAKHARIVNGLIE